MNEPILFKHPLTAEMRQRVRELRQEATGAEQLLWRLLRNRQMMGYKFRRQHPVAGYIVDFYCHAAKLAIEVDGGQHAGQEQAARDRQRTEILEAEGLRVIRFWNYEVLEETEAVMGVIAEALNAPHPGPLP
jgi:very-short-patch-repair endonuclease